MSDDQIDFTLDRIGDRLSGRNLTEQERVLAADDKVRVDWLLSRAKFTSESGRKAPVIDIGASDGALTSALIADGYPVFAIERHPAHVGSLSATGAWCYFGEAADGLMALPPVGWGVAMCGEVFEHLSEIEGALIIRRLKQAGVYALLVTVPNSRSASYEEAGRARWAWPDHRRTFTADSLHDWLTDCGCWIHSQTPVEPIVGTRDDSIWLGVPCKL